MRKTMIFLVACSVGFAPIPSRFQRDKTVEDFSETKADVTKGYRDFEYQSNVPGSKASVVGGTLRLSGDHDDEGDQRLYITARKVTGKVTWPKSLKVVAKLGGTAKDNISWHVGVSVGKVKILFHPGYTGGGFRAENVDTHETFFGNEDMGFTPATGVIHEMTIQVEQTDRSARFSVTVLDGKANGGKHNKSFEVSRDQLGTFDRVGLERSGRRGGDALFDSVTIEVDR